MVPEVCRARTNRLFFFATKARRVSKSADLREKYSFLSHLQCFFPLRNRRVFFILLLLSV